MRSASVFSRRRRQPALRIIERAKLLVSQKSEGDRRVPLLSPTALRRDPALVCGVPELLVQASERIQKRMCPEPRPGRLTLAVEHRLIEKNAARENVVYRLAADEFRLGQSEGGDRFHAREVAFLER
jgi:hypothetical protein